MAQRGIEAAEVETVLANGTVIATYPEDVPRPSYLVLGWIKDRPLHVLAADDPAAEETVVVTAYVPDPARWEEDYRRRKP